MIIQKEILQIAANPDLFIVRIIVALNLVMHLIFLIPLLKPEKNTPLIKETGLDKKWILFYLLGVIIYSGVLSFFNVFGYLSTCISIILLFGISIYIPARIKLNLLSQSLQTANNNIDFKTFCELYEISKREAEITIEICTGKTNKAIAEKLFITIQTVKDHNHRIFTKMGVKTRVQLSNLVREKTGMGISNIN